MGKAIWGPYGPITGKLGNLVYYRVNGESRVRTQRKVTVPPSQAQLKVRMEMKVVTSFLKQFTELLNIGFVRSSGNGKSSYNLATSYNKINALKGVYPDIRVDYAKVRVSMGDLFNAFDLSVSLEADGLVFSWNGNFPMYYPYPTDQTLVLAYFPLQNRAVYGLFGARRADGTVGLLLPADLIAEPMEVYFAFVATDRKKVSTSQYLGRLN